MVRWTGDGVSLPRLDPRARHGQRLDHYGVSAWDRLYPVMIILTAFLDNGWLLLGTVLFFGLQLTRYSTPSDPTLAMV